jgi:hypothetical protein
MEDLEHVRLKKELRIMVLQRLFKFEELSFLSLIIEAIEIVK